MYRRSSRCRLCITKRLVLLIPCVFWRKLRQTRLIWLYRRCLWQSIDRWQWCCRWWWWCCCNCRDWGCLHTCWYVSGYRLKSWNRCRRVVSGVLLGKGIIGGRKSICTSLITLVWVRRGIGLLRLLWRPRRWKMIWSFIMRCEIASTTAGRIWVKTWRRIGWCARLGGIYQSLRWRRLITWSTWRSRWG